MFSIDLQYTIDKGRMGGREFGRVVGFVAGRGKSGCFMASDDSECEISSPRSSGIGQFQI